MKVCIVCGVLKSLDNYHNKSKNKDGLDNRCKKCKSDYHKERYKRPEIKKLGRLASRKFSMKKLGISQDEIDHFYDLQGSKCAICFITEKEYGKLLALDHNHTNGKVRGLLCQQCNTGLGNFKDNVAFLQRAIVYLVLTP